MTSREFSDYPCQEDEERDPGRAPVRGHVGGGREGGGREERKLG